MAVADTETAAPSYDAGSKPRRHHSTVKPDDHDDDDDDDVTLRGNNNKNHPSKTITQQEDQIASEDSETETTRVARQADSGSSDSKGRRKMSTVRWKYDMCSVPTPHEHTYRTYDTRVPV